MEAVKRHEILKEIATLKAQIAMAAKLREMVDKFKHYKQVNKRFIDALKEEGYWGYLGTQYGSNHLSMSKGNISIESRVYSKEITWDTILENIPPYEKWLEEAENRLSSLDKDIKKLGKILAMVKENKMLNFYTGTLEMHLENAIKNSGSFESVCRCNHWKCNAIHPKEKEGDWCPTCDNGHIRQQYVKIESK